MANIQETLQKLANHYEQFNASIAMRLLAESVKKTVKIQIAAEDQKALKDAGYSLCFAKKVEGKYTVVWQSYKKYLANNTFSWVPTYQVFGTNIFEENVTVEAATDPVKIGLNERTTLTSEGTFTSAVSGGSKTSFTIKNEYGKIHLGVNQMSIGLDGREISTPIYVAPTPMAVMGEAVLTPVEVIRVWFQQDIVTSTMISNITSKSCEIDLTDENTYAVKFENEDWKHIG